MNPLQLYVVAKNCLVLLWAMECRVVWRWCREVVWLGMLPVWPCPGTLVPVVGIVLSLLRVLLGWQAPGTVGLGIGQRWKVSCIVTTGPGMTLGTSTHGGFPVGVIGCRSWWCLRCLRFGPTPLPLLLATFATAVGPRRPTIVRWSAGPVLPEPGGGPADRRLIWDLLTGPFTKGTYNDAGGGGGGATDTAAEDLVSAVFVGDDFEGGASDWRAG